jgi:conjugal transfer pilus assembly protein TraW
MQNSKLLIGVVALVSVLGTTVSMAQDLGVIGPTYDITEKDLVQVIKDGLRRMQATGQLAQVENQYKQRVIYGFQHPKPVPGIRDTETARTFYVDPTYILDRNITDGHGRLLYPAGTRVNPFDYESMSKALLFFDGSDPKQVAFAKRFMAESKIVVKPILVAGDPFKLMHDWQKPVYFDQMGYLSKRFSITQSPAVVTQDGKRFRIDEIKLDN